MTVTIMSTLALQWFVSYLHARQIEKKTEKSQKFFFVVKWNVHPGPKRPPYTSNRTSALCKRVHRQHANAKLGQESRLMLKQMLHADSIPAATP